MPVVDQAALTKILSELMQVIQEIRAFVPSNNTSPDAPKVPAPANVLQLPPPNKTGLNLPHPPGSQKPCVLCLANMANIVLYPCMHCVICGECWKTKYALSSRDGKTSAFPHQPNQGCPVTSCTHKKITSAYTVAQYISAKRESEVHYRQKNEYLGDSAALV